VRFKLRVPEVVALTDYDRLTVAHVTFSRRSIFKRDHYACQYCGAQPVGMKRPASVPDAHGRLRIGKTRFDSSAGCWDECSRSVAERTRPCEGRRPGSTPGEDTEDLTPEPDGTATASGTVRSMVGGYEVGSTPTGASDRPTARFGLHLFEVDRV